MVDPILEVRPTIRALKRALLIALRCVDPDSEKRPKMGQVARMLESEEVPFREVMIKILLYSNVLCCNHKFFLTSLPKRTGETGGVAQEAWTSNLLQRDQIRLNLQARWKGLAAQDQTGLSPE